MKTGGAEMVAVFFFVKCIMVAMNEKKQLVHERDIETE